MKQIACRWPAAMAIVIAAALCTGAQACNVPVFRFALERWRPDSYRVVLFHRGELTDGQRQMLEPLQQEPDAPRANLAIRLVDLSNEVDLSSDSADSEQNAADRALYEALGRPPLPWLVVQYPEHLRIAAPTWAGPLSPKLVSAAIDSPIRQELAQRLASGQTAVWLLLESGHAEKDQAAAALLEQHLRRLEQELELPELTTSPDDQLTTAVPLKLAFSLLRVPRSVAYEHALVAMLIGSEPDLADQSDPMVFPVFGKGRALWALIGAGITEKNIHEAAAFLAGPCSCQVKEQNPGFDLLLNADWDALLARRGISLTAVQTRATPPSAEPELVPIPPGSSPPAEPPLATAARSPAPAEPILRQPLFTTAIGVASLIAVAVLLVVASRAGA